MIIQDLSDPRLQMGNTSYLRFPAERAFSFLNQLRRKRYSISILDEIGLFSRARAGSDGKVRYHSITGEQFPIRPYSSGCDWNPVKVKYDNNLVEVPLCPVELKVEYCDNNMDTCMRNLFFDQDGSLLDWHTGASNVIRDRYWMETRDKIMDDVHNNLLMLSFFGAHPAIKAAISEDSYGKDAEVYDQFAKSMEACEGIITQADKLWESPGEFSQFKYTLDADAKGNYIGVASEDFERLIHANDEVYDAKYSGLETQANVFILVSDDVFRSYQEEIKAGGKDCCGENSWLWSLMLGVQNLPLVERAAQLNGRALSNALLEWNGCVVVNMSAFRKFDKLVGMRTPRIMVTKAGNFGGFSRGREIEAEDYGMIITRIDQPQYRGKIFVEGAWELAPHILFPDMMAYARAPEFTITKSK